MKTSGATWRSKWSRRKFEFTAGIVSGIQKAGPLLAGHFPRRTDDQNEQPKTRDRD